MRRNNPFTLLELILAMGILSVIMVLMLSFFSAAQKVWMTSSANAEIYENARVAMDLMTRDLQSALYNNENSTKGIYPFWHESDNRINFISATNVGDANDISNIREVKYARSDGTITPDDLRNGTPLKAGWLVRSVTGDFSIDPADANDKTKPLNKYNFALFPGSDGDTQRTYKIFKEIAGGTDTAKGSSSYFNYVVPYVVSLKFTCYNSLVQDMRDINDDGDNADAVYNFNSSNTAAPTPFPYAIKIDIVLLDRASWSKWRAMGGVVANPDSDAAGPKAFRKSHQRSFTKMIFFGERNSR
jgi:type II secretory pathway pseudopilin PulG